MSHLLMFCRFKQAILLSIKNLQGIFIVQDVTMVLITCFLISLKIQISLNLRLFY